MAAVMDSGSEATAEQPLLEQPGRDALPSFHHSREDFTLPPHLSWLDADQGQISNDVCLREFVYLFLTKFSQLSL
jgi:hypothetical protein